MISQVICLWMLDDKEKEGVNEGILVGPLADGAAGKWNFLFFKNTKVQEAMIIAIVLVTCTF